MTTITLHPLAANYLDRLDRAARRLPRGERRELVEEISAHLSEASDPGMSDAEVLTVLDRLDEPEDIIEAQRPEETGRRRGILEWSAIFLLLFGGFLIGLGWIAGVILLWSSRAWSTRDKLIGTLIVPGGLATAAPLVLITGSKRTCTSISGGVTHCTGGPSTLHQVIAIGVFAFCVLGPICTAVYLARRAR